MKKIECGHWTLRFWISDPFLKKEGQLEKTLEKVKEIPHQLTNQFVVTKIDDVEETIRKKFDHFDRIAAFEILNKQTGEGIVNYIEWP